jgi:hypothetical protein
VPANKSGSSRLTELVCFVHSPQQKTGRVVVPIEWVPIEHFAEVELRNSSFHPKTLREVCRDLASFVEVAGVQRMWTYRAWGIVLLHLRWKETIFLPPIVRAYHAGKSVHPDVRWWRIIFLPLTVRTHRGHNVVSPIALWKEITFQPLKVQTYCAERGGVFQALGYFEKDSAEACVFVYSK